MEAAKLLVILSFIFRPLSSAFMAEKLERSQKRSLVVFFG